MKLRATSFATDQDLVAYYKCRETNSDAWCTSHAGGGDNGEGAWGNDTTSRTHKYCALGPSLQKKGQQVKVQLFRKNTSVPLGKEFLCIQGDKGNEGIIDLNPGSLFAAGLEPNAELSCDAQITLL